MTSALRDAWIGVDGGYAVDVIVLPSAIHPTVDFDQQPDESAIF
jgi:hypothetical protein